jgi:ethanolamine ammonia-lyase large subunit
MRYGTVIASQIFAFDDLKQVMAYASPERSGDTLAGISAATAQSGWPRVMFSRMSRSNSS